jgi:3'-5' exoribonuclease
MSSNSTPADLLTISQLKRRALDGSPVEAQFHAQIDALVRKETRDGKPYFEAVMADSESRLPLRAWADSPAFPACERLQGGEFVAISGEFSHSAQFGVESRRWQMRPLSDEERTALLGGPEPLRLRQAADYAQIESLAASIEDPRLHHLARLFLDEYGERFRRSAAARGNHHARRGGLVEHVAQMMRTAHAIAATYPTLHRDLLLAGTLFHDCGKLWENLLPPDGFTMPFDELGEMLGHITIGIEVVNVLWRRIVSTEEAASWKDLTPSTEDVRRHLLHLIASHHGELQFGSPVVPKTPEAWALHYIDNLDAKLEMMAGAYTQGKPLAPRIRERVWPLPGHLVLPLNRPPVASDLTDDAKN